MKRTKQNGITLIALVITIIVLLILAAVSIVTLTGENGILTRATDAKEQTEIADEKEAIQLAYAGAVAEKRGTGDVTADDLNNEFTTNGRTDANASGENPITVTFDSGRSYTIDADGNISDPTISNIVATMEIVGDAKTEEEVINDIPDGFYYVEGTHIDTGLVISSVDGDDLNNSAEGNQFVWVPVDKDQKLKISVKTEENIESIKLTTPYGEEQELEKIDYQEINLTENENYINGVYKLTVTAGGETKEIELDVYSLYAQRMWELDMLTEEMAQLKGYPDLTAFMQDYFGTSGTEETRSMIIEAYKTGMWEDTVDYTSQVNENGGFYIGRYEASDESGNVAIKKNRTPWNNIPLEGEEGALSKAENMYPNSDFTSTLLTGAAWDRTLCWLYETREKSMAEIVGDSTSWGNYPDDNDGNSGIINTGTERTVANNIYDLAGNLSEWTIEANDTTGRVNRGGNYFLSGSNYPACDRDNNSPSNAYDDVGFRPALFL